MHKGICLALLGLGSVLTTAAQTEVSTYTPGITPNGITYFLPRTGLHLTITARRTSYTPGEYAAYAERYLRQKGVVQKAYDEWELTGISIVGYGEADPTKAFTIALNPKTSAPLVALAPDGRLLAVNADQAPVIPALSTPSVTPDPVSKVRGADYKTEEILSAGSKAKMAELTAAEIYDIRDNRSLLTKGQADFMPKDGEQLRLMLAQLDEQEEGLLQLFRGTSTSETHVFTLDYVPQGDVDRYVLFRFSKHLGLVGRDDVAGVPYYISVTDLHALPAEQSDPKAKSGKPVQDLRYIVPGKANVVISRDDATLYTGTFVMGQYGRIEHLGGDLFNKKYTTRVWLSPENGGVTKIEADQP